jgi:hypothetical protein
MNAKKKLLSVVGIGLAIGGIGASQVSALTTCWVNVPWGQNYPMVCSEVTNVSGVFSEAHGTTGSSTSGNKSLAADLTSVKNMSTVINGQTFPRYGRVRNVGLNSSGNEIANCDTGWDYDAKPFNVNGGTSVADTTDCGSATSQRSYGRVSLTSTHD